MKPILPALLVALTLCCATAVAQKTPPPVQAGQTDSTSQEILKALQAIQGLQEEARQERLEAVHYRDSVNRHHNAAANSSEYSVMSDVERNTRFNFWEDGVSLLALLALLVSIGSLYYALVTYKAQKRTEKNTQNAPLSVQKSKLKDLARHFYRNLVCSSAAIFKFKDASNRDNPQRRPVKYPSESNLLKLQVLPDDIVMPIDVSEKSYEQMHELRLLFRNYNVEVSVASLHLSRKDISDESLVQDFDNLLFKPIALVGRTFKYEQALYDESKETLDNQAARSIVSMVVEHFKKLMVPGNFGVLLNSVHLAFLRTLLADKCAAIQGFIDKKDGIVRSLNGLVEKGFEQQEKGINGKVVAFKAPDGDDPNACYSATVDKAEFLKALPKGNLKDFVTRLSGLAVSGQDLMPDQIGAFCRAFYEGKIRGPQGTITPDQAIWTLQPYLYFLNAEKWDVEQLLKYMLAVDTAIEIDRIGMVNYAD